MLLSHLDDLFECLALSHAHHARGTAFYRTMDAMAKYAFQELKPSFVGGGAVRLAEYGDIRLPYEKMGAVDSIDLFGLDELIMFAFYHRNRGRYRKAVDIGANVGLHSILLAKSGFEVDAYEPDPVHHGKLLRNLELNQARCNAFKSAVSDSNGHMEFVRVVGNTTSSHLAGSKPNPYGDLERFHVEVRDIGEVVAGADLLKIDAEGHEVRIVTAMALDGWRERDALVEIGSPDNARSLFEHFQGTPVRVFTQKTGWQAARELQDYPESYKQGSAFISVKSVMPW